MKKKKKQINDAPTWLLKREGITQRQWKAQKRYEMREVIKALLEFQQGCAYTPRVPPEHCFGSVKRSCEVMLQAMSVKNWGR